MATEPEEWRVIEDHPEYEVSDLGRLRRALPGRNTWPGRILKGSKNAKGYWFICLATPNGVKRCAVSVLVCQAFHGPRLPGMQAAHGDGCKDNNTKENLRWATATENNADKKLHETYLSGETHPASKLKREQVVEIRRAKTSVAYKLGKKCGITARHVWLLRAKPRRHWIGVE